MAFAPSTKVMTFQTLSPARERVRGVVSTKPRLLRNGPSSWRMVHAKRSKRSVVLALDVGTSGTKAGVVCCETTEVLSIGQCKHPTSFLDGQRVTQDLSDWITSCRKASQEATSALPLSDAFRLEAVAVTGSMQNLGILEGNRRVSIGDEFSMGKMILYSDARSVNQAQRLSSSVGSPVFATSLLAKLLYLDDHLGASAEDIEGFRVALGAADAVVHFLCGALVTDPTNLSTTGLSAHPHHGYDEHLFAKVGLGRWLSAMPQVQANGFRPCGHVSPLAAEQLGLPSIVDGVPVVHAGGDAASTTMGSGVTGSDDGKYVYLGTSGWVGGVVPYNSESSLQRERAANGVFYLAHPTSRDAALELGSMSSVGSCISWAGEAFLNGASPSEVVEIASHSPIGANGVSFMPWLSGRRCPRPSTEATATFAGLSARHSKADIARAVVEGIGFGIAECFEATGGEREAFQNNSSAIRIVGGCARSSLVRSTISGALGCQVKGGSLQEVALLGAARAAMIALGKDFPEDCLSQSQYGNGPQIVAKLSEEEVDAYRRARSRWQRCSSESIS